MKSVQNGNLAKLVAFFAIAITIACTVSFAANGWQSFIPEPDSDNVASDENSDNNNVDENTDGDTTNKDEDIPVVAPTPKYYHYLTGLETDLESSMKKPLCLILSSQDPLYGISSSYLTIEFPIEHGDTRLMCFTDTAQTLGKIGSLAPSRGYISNFATYFGGVLLSYGNDDTFEYEYYMPNNELDFKNTTGYCYTEYNTLVYTNGDLISAFLNNSRINTVVYGSTILPFDFNQVDASPLLGDNYATNIVIRYSESNSTELVYSSIEGKYYFSKNSTGKSDLLNDKILAYDNIFVLYADSTTHETADSTQMILNTTDGGKGVYISNGRRTDITWIRDVSGNLCFFDDEGEKLVINRGSSYIAFSKSSNEALIKIS